MSKAPDLMFTVHKLITLGGDGPLKAFVDVTINNAITIKGFRVVEGAKGLFVGMPRLGAKNGKWFDCVALKTLDAKQRLDEAVLVAYRNESQS